MMHFGTIFTKARDGVMFRLLQSTLTCPKHCYKIPHATFPLGEQHRIKSEQTERVARIDRSNSLTGEIDIQLIPELNTRIYRSYSTIPNRSRSPYALFSTDRIDSIQDEEYRIEVYIDYRNGALSFSICSEELIVRDQDPSLEPGSLNVHAEICSVRGWLVRSARAQHTCCSAAWFFYFLGSLSVKRPPCEPPHTGVRERSWARQRQ